MDCFSSKLISLPAILLLALLCVSCSSGSDGSGANNNSGAASVSDVKKVLDKSIDITEGLILSANNIGNVILKLVQNGLVTGIYPCDLGGTVTVNILVLPNEKISLDFSNCSLKHGTSSGIVELDISRMEINGFGELQLQALASFGDNFISADNTLSGSYLIAYQQTYLGGGIRIEVLPSDFFAINEVTVSNAKLVRENYRALQPKFTAVLFENLTNLEFSIDIESAKLGNVNCSSASIKASDINRVYETEILCIADDASSSKAVSSYIPSWRVSSNSLIFYDDIDGDGDYREVVTSRWSELVDDEYFNVDQPEIVGFPAQQLPSAEIAIPSNDVVIHPVTNLIYLSSPSSAAVSPNSIIVVNPDTLQIVATEEMPGEPLPLALSSDGSVLYVGIVEPNQILQLSTADFSVMRTIELGTDSFLLKSYIASAIEVSPVDSEEIVVALDQRGFADLLTWSHTAKYISGIKAPDIIQFGFSVTHFKYSADGSTIYGTGALYTPQDHYIISNGPTGLSVEKTLDRYSISTGVYPVGSLIYSTDGRVIDTENEVLIGAYNKASNFYDLRQGVLVDDVRNRVYLVGDYLEVYDKSTFVVLSTYYIEPDTFLSIHSVEDIDNNSFLIASNNMLRVVSKTDVNDVQTQVCSVETLVDVIQDKQYSFIPCSVNDAIYHAGTDTIYATIPGAMGPDYGNALMKIDATTNSIASVSQIGPDPNQLAISNDGSRLYIGLDGTGEIVEWDPVSDSEINRFYIGVGAFGPLFAGDLAVYTNDPASVIVSSIRWGISPPYGGLVMYTNGIEAPLSLTLLGNDQVDVISFGSDPGMLFGFNNTSTGFSISVMPVDATGIIEQNQYDGLASGFDADMKFSNNRLYFSGGEVIDVTDPFIPNLIGELDIEAPGLLVSADADGQRSYIHSYETYNYTRGPLIQSFDTDTFLRSGRLDLPRYRFSLFPENALIEAGDSLVLASPQGLLLIDKSLIQ